MADIVPSVATSEGIIAALPVSLSGASVLLPQAQKAPLQLAEALHQRGAQVTRLVLYDVVDRPLPEGVSLKDGDRIVLMSGTQVTTFFNTVYAGESITCIVPSESLRTHVQRYYDGPIRVASGALVEDIVTAISSFM